MFAIIRVLKLSHYPEDEANPYEHLLGTHQEALVGSVDAAGYQSCVFITRAVKLDSSQFEDYDIVHTLTNKSNDIMFEIYEDDPTKVDEKKANELELETAKRIIKDLVKLI